MVTFRVKDQQVYVTKLSSSLAYCNVVITPVISPTVNLCISPCEGN